MRRDGGFDGPDVPVLLVGNFLSEAGGSRGVCEDLALRLPHVGCPVLTTSSKRRRLPRVLDMVGAVWRQRDRYTVAHVDVFSGAAFLWAEAACATLRLARKPFILTLHGGDLPRFAMTRPKRVRRLLQSAAIVTTPSRYLLESLSPYCHGIRLIPNGVDVGEYSPRTQAARPRLVWLRAFHRLYNPSLAVRMLPLLVDRFPDIQLTMIGTDKGDGSLQAAERLAAELGMAARIAFSRAVPKKDIPAALRSGDIFINTSVIDNAPVTVIEAMACGLCVVTTNVGGIPYLMEDERDALLVPPDDPQAMAGAVRRILDDPDLGSRLARHGRQKAEQFDWKPIICEWRSLLRAIAERAA